MNRLTEQDLQHLREDAKRSRAAILQMTTLAASGHPGGSMSSLDFLLTLYRLAHVDPDNPRMTDRDMVVVSNGHISPAVYCALASRGFFPLDDAIVGYRQAGSIFEGHVEPAVPGIEWGTGNLGQGLSAGTGFALGRRLQGIQNHVFVVMGDGEQQKGQIGEARRFAAKYAISNLIALIDYNRLQIGGEIKSVMPQRISENWRSDGWNVLEADGHDFRAIASVLIQACTHPGPTAILFHTTMGKGVSFMENEAKYHGSPLKPEQLTAALAELGVPDNTEKYRLLRSQHQVCPPAIHHTEFRMLRPGTPRLYTGSIDNRSAWGNALADLAIENGPNPPMAVFDCDLQGSVKVDGFAKNVPDHFFECGIMEHHAAVTAGAVSVLGIQPFFSDFGVFGVCETYNQHRLTDINHGNLRLVVTHVGLDVGEDGKTHQCIDYLGATRNWFHFRALVPADGNQTDRLVRWMVGEPGNFLMAMGRSKLPIIRKPDGTPFFDEQYCFQYGKADLLREGTKAALLTTGTVTPTALEAADHLAAEGFDVQVWNFATPLVADAEALQQAAATGRIVTCEDHNADTGLGATVTMALQDLGLSTKCVRLGVRDYACSGKAADVFALNHLDLDGIMRALRP